MKKTFAVNIAVALLILAILFIAMAAVFSVIRSDPDDWARQEAAVTIHNQLIIYILIPMTALLMLIPSVQYARLYKNKIGYYWKRMAGLTLILIAVDFGVSYGWSFIYDMVFLNIFIDDRTGVITLPGLILIKLPAFIVYMLIMYRLVFTHFGVKHARNHKFNLNFFILTMLYTFIMFIPWAAVENVSAYANLHTIFTPRMNPTGGGYNFLLAVSLAATLAIETFILSLAYTRGKKAFLESRVSDASFETDEICEP